MRIIVATTHTIPAYSGGWTTPLDLFGTDHQAMYIIRNRKAGTEVIENVTCVGVGATGLLATRGRRGDRFLHQFDQWLFSKTLKKHFHRFGADFILCLEPEAGFAAMNTGLPYAMRLHTKLRPEHHGEHFDRLIRNAVFSTACPATFIPEIEVLPHNQDISRVTYRENPTVERALLLTTINKVREPDLFIEGVMRSKKMKGDIVGTGEDRERIEAVCNKTGGRVRCLPPVPRLKLPDLLSRYQVGVATVQKISPVFYQMKVNDYMAAGLFTLVKPWTHVAQEAPDLVRTFVTATELALGFDYLCDNWEETLEIRRKARDWVLKHYSVEIPRKRFNDILREKFPRKF